MSIIGALVCLVLFGLLFGIIYKTLILKKETIETDIYITSVGLVEDDYWIQFEYTFRNKKRIGQCEVSKSFELGKKYHVKLRLWREFSDPQIITIIDE